MKPSVTGLAIIICTSLVLATSGARAHLSGPHEPLILALKRAESVVVVRADEETRRTAEGAETPVTRVTVVDGRRTPKRFVLAQGGAHVHRLRRGQSYLVPVKRSISGRLLVDFLSESPVHVDHADVKSTRLEALVRALRRGSAQPGGGIDVVDALRRGSVLFSRLAIERVSLAASGVDPVGAPLRSGWVAALAARAGDASLDVVARSEALQLSAGLDANATAEAMGEAALAWTPSALAHQATTLLERTGSAAAHRQLTRCAEGLVPGVTLETRARCRRAAERGPSRASAP